MSGMDVKVKLEREVTEAFYARAPHVRRDGSFTPLAAAATVRMRGTMLWFNAAKDLGVLQTNDGERIQVPGAAFAPDEKPVGRCAGKAIQCELLDGALSGIAFVPQPDQRRARRRHR